MTYSRNQVKLAIDATIERHEWDVQPMWSDVRDSFFEFLDITEELTHNFANCPHEDVTKHFEVCL
jgi:hypothetical protein